MASFRANVIANYLGRATSLASIYVFVPLYVAVLGIDAYGIIAFYTILLSFASLFDAGISATFSRQAAFLRDRKELLDLFTTFGRVLLISQLAVALVVFIMASPIARHWLNLGDRLDQGIAVASVQLMALTLVPQLMMSFYTGGLMGLQKQVEANLLQASFSLVRSGLVIIPIYFRPDLRVFFLWQAAVALGFAFLSRGYLLSAMGYGLWQRGHFVIDRIKPLLGYSAGMLAMTIIATINTQLDKVIVSSRFEIATFSYYSLAASLAQIPLALSQPIAAALFPRLTTLVAAGDAAQLARIYRQQSAMISALAGLAAMTLAGFTPEVLAVWFPHRVMPDQVATVTRILALGGWFLALQLGPYYLSLAHGENRVLVILATLSLAVSVPLTFLLISRYGLIGAAIPWLVLGASNFVLLSSASHRRFYPGQTWGWLWGSIIRPTALAALLLGLARAAANGLAFGPVATLAMAGVAGALALAVTYTSLRRV